MSDTISGDFVRLALTLIQQLPSSPSETPDEAVLLRLQMVFGPMLMSALQLVDRREVLHVTFPTKRQIWQVGSSSGTPYTIHLALPPPKPAASASAPSAQGRDESALIPAARMGEIEDRVADEPHADSPAEQAKVTVDGKARERVQLGYVERAMNSLQGVYCPCTGFAYNSLSSERNIFCKHLLAILLADRMGRAYRTEALMYNVAGLLDLARVVQEDRIEEVKVETGGVKMEVDE